MDTNLSHRYSRLAATWKYDSVAPVTIVRLQDPVDHVDDSVRGWYVGSVQRGHVHLHQTTYGWMQWVSATVALAA